MKNNIGVYAIRCLVNDKIYIGSSSDLSRRKSAHFYRLKKGVNNKNLQADYNIYGKDNFVFEILAYCDKSDLVSMEERFLDAYSDRLYNISKATDISTYNRSEEFKGHVSPVLKGRQKSVETRIKMRRITIEKCLEVKKLLIENKDMSKMELYNKVSELSSVSRTTVEAIVYGRHWSSIELGGGLKEWI